MAGSSSTNLGTNAVSKSELDPFYKKKLTITNRPSAVFKTTFVPKFGLPESAILDLLHQDY